MRRKRNRGFEGVSYFHVMSRTVNGEALFGKREKEVFRKMIWQVAEFSGVRVITYAVMNNHFHLLLEVPERNTEVSDEEIVRRFKVLYPRPTPWQPMRAEVLKSHLSEGTAEGKEIKRQLLARMHDVSEMVKTLKQRFSLWFNRSKERFGPLWSDRFKSVLIEGDLWVLRTVAAYIDLNPVRAGLVEDPKDYRFCGYGEASGGGKRARDGILLVGRDLAGYRQTLFGAGAKEKDGKSSIGREEMLKVLEKENGRLPVSSILRCRIRYFTDGLFLGSADFVEKQLIGDSVSSRRPRHPKPMSGADWQGLTVGRGIRKNLFS